MGSLSPVSPLVSTMRTNVILLTLVSPLLSMPQRELEVVEEMMDLVESSLDTDLDRRGRGVIVSVTLSLTSTAESVVTLMKTVINSCVTGTFSECSQDSGSSSDKVSTEGEVSARIGDAGLGSSYSGNTFPKAIVTNSQGDIVDISSILPTKVLPQRRSVLDMFPSVDGFLGDTLQSGSLHWKEVAMDTPLSTCGRSDHNRKARFVQLAQETHTVTTTKVTTDTVTATDTVTFSVTLNSCTTPGFVFGVPPCT